MHHELIMIDCANLPYEILYCIGSLLCYNDSLECSKVCEQWYQPFMDSLWRTVKIHSVESNEIFDNNPESKYLINGHLVREIINYEGCKIDSSQLLHLQKLFPNVQRLSLFTKDQDTVVDWSAWQKLIFFKIVFNGSHKDIRTKIFSETFSQLSCLREVSLSVEDWQKISVGDLEAIHNLQHLHTLKLCLKQVDLTLQDLANIAKAVPAKHLSKAELILDISDLRWIYYFIIKYQNVRELNVLNASFEYVSVESHLEEAKARISMLPQVFSRLEKLKIKPCYDSDMSLDFWKCFSDEAFSIKEITYLFSTVRDGMKRIEDITREIVRVCSKTIESITFILRSPSNIPKNEYITRAFSYCPRLVYLHFYRCGATIEPDTMLEYLPSLKELGLYTGKIYMSSRATKVASSHGLRVINLNAVSTDPDSLKYITTRCESLSHMRLEGVNIFGDISPSTGCCLIDMSNARLTELKIDSLFFKSSCQEWKWNLFTELHFMKIARLTALHVRNIKGIENTEISVNISNDTISTWHDVLGRDSYPRNGDTLITGQTKVNTIEEYFQDFQVNRVRDRIQHTVISETNQKPDNWTMNLWRGYALFVFGHTKKYDIDSVIKARHGERFKWDKDKNIVKIAIDIVS
ncbi:hypothetical protein CLU79DRAFT_455761 [Phycomyces nitens]|nr:hypothetical protein CLU79DRAFT_455761 [Phycomyces nitens]